VLEVESYARKNLADLNRFWPKYVSHLYDARATSWVAELPALFRVYGQGLFHHLSQLKRFPKVVGDDKVGR
jgi:hypothetical protein